jgi:hypothetical protein
MEVAKNQSLFFFFFFFFFFLVCWFVGLFVSTVDGT